MQNYSVKFKRFFVLTEWIRKLKIKNQKAKLQIKIQKVC